MRKDTKSDAKVLTPEAHDDLPAALNAFRTVYCLAMLIVNYMIQGMLLLWWRGELSEACIPHDPGIAGVPPSPRRRNGFGRFRYFKLVYVLFLICLWRCRQVL